jgi:hypothetical protein
VGCYLLYVEASRKAHKDEIPIPPLRWLRQVQQFDGSDSEIHLAFYDSGPAFYSPH